MYNQTCKVKHIKAYSEHIHEKEEYAHDGIHIKEIDRDGNPTGETRVFDIPYFSGANLTKGLSELDFSGAQMSGVNIDSARIWHSKFVETEMLYANIGYSRINDSDFSKADLSAARIYDTSIGTCTFNETDFTGAVFKECRFDGTKFVNCNFTNTVFDNETCLMSIYKSDVTGEDVIGFSFEGCRLSGSNIFDFIEPDDPKDFMEVFKNCTGIPERVKKSVRSRGAFGRF